MTPLYRGSGFTAGWYRPNKPGTVAIPAGPTQPIEERPEPQPKSAIDCRAKQATAENLERLSLALGPRRFSWEDGE